MTTLLGQFRNASYLQNATTLFVFFGGWAIWWSFFQLWLSTSLHFDGAQIGTIYSVNSLFTLVVMFVYGTLQDKLGIKRTLAIVAAVAMTLIAPFMIWVYIPLLQNAFMVGVVLGGIVLSVGFLSTAGLLESIAERCSRRYGYEYGQCRMWGSFGYALLALFAGALFNVDPAINFWIASAMGLVCLVVLVFWKSPERSAADVEAAEDRTPSFGEMLGLLRMPSLWAVILVVFFTWTFYTVYDQQMFPQFYTGLFATQEIGNEVYGVLNSVQVFLEAVMLGVVPLLMRKVGARNTLMLGIGVMCVRILGSAIFSDPVVVSCIKMLHAFEVPLFVLAIFKYFTLHFDRALSATLYMVGFNVAAQIGNIVLSPALGRLLDAFGFRPVFFMISGMVLVAGIAAYFLLRRDDQAIEQPGDTARDDLAHAV